jgi:hypothetical protein
MCDGLQSEQYAPVAFGHADYVARLVSWAERVSSVRGIIVLGSVAQIGTEDALSDLDVMIITTRPRQLRRGEWLADLSPAPVLSWTYRSPVGGQTVRQIVYDGPFVVDVATTSWIQAALSGVAVAAITRLPQLRRVVSADECPATRCLVANYERRSTRSARQGWDRDPYGPVA